MVTIFFFNGRADDFNERLTACQKVFKPKQYDQQYDREDTPGDFADRYTEFIRNSNSQKICFLHTSPLQQNIVNNNLGIQANQNDVYAVWFSGDGIRNRPRYRHYFPNSIFAPPTENGEGPNSPIFWRAVRRQISENWGDVL